MTSKNDFENQIFAILDGFLDNFGKIQEKELTVVFEHLNFSLDAKPEIPILNGLYYELRLFIIQRRSILSIDDY